MKKIILDTNFLLIPHNFKVDIFSEISRIIDDSYELFIIDKTIDELRKIVSTGKGKDKKAAEIGLELIEKKGIKRIISESYVDKAIISIAGSDYIVATQDADLKRKLKCRKIVLRQKNHLELL